MARKTDHLADFEADDSGGVLSNLLADEDELDRRALWRIGSWGVGATAAVILAVMANQSSLGLKREQVAAADITRQAQQIQLVARETQNEARRLAAAIDTLNGDRDRLYSRVTSLEQGLESVTGAIARHGSAQALPPLANAEPQAAQKPPSPSVAPVASTPPADKPTAANAEPSSATVSPAAKDAAKTDAAKADSAKPETTKAEMVKADSATLEPVKPEPAKPSPATPLMAAMAPPDPAAGKLIEPGKASGPVIASPIPDVVASAPSDAEADDATAPKVSLQRTEFGVDLGSANSVNGLRALWRGLLKSRSNAPLTALRPIIVVKEGTNGLGMQLRLVAGPLNDAGAAARICAIMAENNRPCETAIFDGQRLSVKSDDPPPIAAKPGPRRRAIAKQPAATVVEEVQNKPEPPPATPQPTLSSIFGRKNSQ
ncbi:hypothetical protein IVA95_01770 [Bradyrhizobium sp. 157]|uniref:hypothetical protein n=1 Tax=Bradyrhizobium sp. 157 TaxID=2782631 RepID=UPI001FF8A6CC|nr:hypothetical protein [Bradyrhizobium sp. 157]MCK1636344.1 hypothetical protein [Bradyrhizobium sp. 157]